MEKSHAKIHIKKGDTVSVIAGSEKGKTGKVLRVMPSENKAVVEKLNMVKRHTKASAKNPSAGIVEKESGIHVSNLAKYDSKSRKPAKG
ncbi:MAG: 50S ribosomal protein L24 [Deltaproteobacteria bacterium]